MNTPIDLISGATTTDVNTRAFISNVTTNTTVTVPVNSTDGANPLFSREVAGNSSLVTLQSDANAIKVNPLTAVTNYLVFPGNNVELMAYDNTYLVGRTGRNASMSVVPRFSSFPSPSSLNITQAATSFILSIVNMNTRAQPSSLTICLTRIGTSSPSTVIGNLVLATDNTLTTLIMSIPVTITNSSATIVFTTNVLLNSTVFGNNYYVGWIRTSPNTALSIRVDSIIIT